MRNIFWLEVDDFLDANSMRRAFWPRQLLFDQLFTCLCVRVLTWQTDRVSAQRALLEFLQVKVGARDIRFMNFVKQAPDLICVKYR